MNTYKAALTNYRPVGFDKRIKWDKVMAVWVVTNDMLGVLRKRSAIGAIKRGVREAFFDDYYYSVEGTGSALLFYGEYNWRADHERTFHNLCSNLKGVVEIKATKQKPKIHVIRGLAYLFLFCIWIIQAMLSGCNFVQACNVVRPLSICYKSNKLFSESCFKNALLLIAYYDVSPDESYVVQKAKLMGLKTATLQHGIFSEKKDKKALSDTGFEYSESVSDYYFAWNQYTKDEWLKMGLDEKKIIVVGIPKFAGNTTKATDNTKSLDVFGVILNNSSFDAHNRLLVMTANKISESLGMCYVIRFHPELKGGIKKAYEELADDRYFIGESDNKVSVPEYSNTVKFSIISSSSVFVDLVFLGADVYRLIVTDSDTYSNVKQNSFCNAEEFTKLYKDKTSLDNLFDYLCTTRDVSGSYQNVINSLLIDGVSSAD